MPKAYASTMIDSPVEEVWKHVHDFNNVAAWHPAVAEAASKMAVPATGWAACVSCVWRTGLGCARS